MNGNNIRKVFLSNLDKRIPNIEQIESITLKKKPICRDVLLVGMPILATAALVVALFATSAPEKRDRAFVIEPDSNEGQHGIERPEDADWKVALRGETGPRLEQSVTVSFGNSGFFGIAINSGMVEADLEQGTILKVKRQVHKYLGDETDEWTTTTIYENESNFYEHFVSSSFAFDPENLFVVDTFTANDLMDSEKKLKGGSITYYVTIEALDGGTLSYGFIERDGMVSYDSVGSSVRSAKNAHLYYSILDDGVFLSEGEKGLSA